MPKVAPHVLKRLGELLHDQFNEIAAQPLPERWVELIHHLNQQERDTGQHARQFSQPQSR